jgi:NAD(P)-dependent dehydrogenase (short-subunit alcohol dehydrogenase family)
MGLTFVPMTIAGLSGVAGSDAGVASGLNNTSRQIGGAVGIAAVSTIVATYANDGTAVAPTAAGLTHGFDVAFVVLTGLGWPVPRWPRGSPRPCRARPMSRARTRDRRAVGRGGLMPGRTVLVTGATDGLGKALAAELAAAASTVLVHGRDDSRGERTIAEIRERTGSDDLRWYRADLASLAEVRDLAEVLAAEHERLDVLVNNAGIGATLPGDGRRRESADGVELRFAVNYLAPFLLTRMLLPRLVDSAPARIVNVASAGQAPIDFGDVMLERPYDGIQAYCQSKLALVMLTLDLAEELRDRGVTANCLHPGTYMPTKMVTHAGVSPIDSLETGVRATMNLVASPELSHVSGRYFDRLTEARGHPQAYDPAARSRLRDLSERLIASA